MTRTTNRVVVASAFIDGVLVDVFEALDREFSPIPLGDTGQAWELPNSYLFAPHNWAYLDTHKAEIWCRVVCEPSAPWWIVRNFRAAPAEAGKYHHYITARFPGSLCDPHASRPPNWLHRSSVLSARELHLHHQILASTR